MSNTQQNPTIFLTSITSGNEVEIEYSPKYQVRVDGEQPEQVRAYRDSMLNSAEFPETEVVEWISTVGTRHMVLVSGYHRAAAYSEAHEYLNNLKLKAQRGDKEAQQELKDIHIKPLYYRTVGQFKGTEKDFIPYAHRLGFASNSQNSTPLTKTDRKAMVELLWNQKESTEDIVKLTGVPSRTVREWTKPLRVEANKIAVLAILPILQKSPNTSVDTLMNQVGTFGRSTMGTIKKLYRFHGEDVVKAWVDNDMKPKGSLDEIVAYFTVQSPSNPEVQEESLEVPNSPSQQGNSNTLPEPSKDSSCNSYPDQTRHLSDSAEEPKAASQNLPGAPVDYEALAYRYANLELLTEDMHIMLDPDIAEQVRKIAKAQVNRSTHNLRHQVKTQQTQIDQLKAALSEAQGQLAAIEESKDKPVEFPKALAVPKPNTDMHDVLKQCRTLRATKDSKVFRDDIYDETVMKYSQLEDMSLSMRKAELKDAKGKPEADVVAIRSEAYALFDLHAVRGE